MDQTRTRGITLLEMLIALSVFAVVMAATLPLANQFMARFQMARDHYVAASICQARIEHARRAPYGDLWLLAEKDALVDDYGNPANPGGRFRRTTRVVADSPVAGMTQMTVSAQICICSRWGWRRHLHPLKSGTHICRFTDEKEEMTFLFTEYKR